MDTIVDESKTSSVQQVKKAADNPNKEACRHEQPNVDAPDGV